MNKLFFMVVGIAHTIQIFDINGRLLQQKEAAKGNFWIDILRLPYFEVAFFVKNNRFFDKRSYLHETSFT